MIVEKNKYHVNTYKPLTGKKELFTVFTYTVKPNAGNCIAQSIHINSQMAKTVKSPLVTELKGNTNPNE